MTTLTTLAEFLAGKPVAYKSFSGKPLTAHYGIVRSYPLTALTIYDANRQPIYTRPMTAGEAESFYHQLDAEVA